MLLLDLRKCVGVVVLDYDDYVNKMLTVFGDDEKIVQLGLDVTHDKTKAIELKFQKCFLKLVKNKNIFLDIYIDLWFLCNLSFMVCQKPTRTTIKGCPFYCRFSAA